MSKTRQKVKEIVKKYKNVLKGLGVNVDRVILYGSHARGRATKYSDIDLIVISEDFRKMNLRERLEILGIAAARIMMPIEAKGYTSKEVKTISRFSFLSGILRAGVKV